MRLAFWRKDTAPLEAKATFKLSEHEPWFSWFGSKSGVGVTINAALGHTTVAACLRVIANDVAKIPLDIKKRAESGTSERATSHPLYKVLRNRPNSWMTAFEFREALTMHACLTGCGYALPLKAANGKITELIPLMPSWVQVDRAENLAPAYTVRVEGRLLGVFRAGEIFRVQGPSWDTIKGIDAVTSFREAIGLSLAIEGSQAGLHGNSTRPSGILSTPNKLSKEAKGQLRASWEEMHKGVDNNFKTAVLDNALAFTPITMTGVDAQLIETRKLQIEEICRAFGVFPQMVGHAENTPYNSAEAFFQAHFRQTVWPWLERWTQSIDRDLLDASGPLFADFDVRAFELASTSDRGKFYRDMAELGIYTRNEIRDREGLPPLPGLDDPLTPLNTGGMEQNGFILEQIRRLSYET